MDEPSKGLRIQGRLVKKPSISEDFWSTSTYEMENSTIQSQRSLSSISVSNQVLSQNIGTGSTSNHSEFVNHGKFTAFSESSFNQNTSPHLFSTFDCYLHLNKTLVLAIIDSFSLFKLAQAKHAYTISSLFLYLF